MCVRVVNLVVVMVSSFKFFFFNTVVFHSFHTKLVLWSGLIQHYLKQYQINAAHNIVGIYERLNENDNNRNVNKN